MNKVILFCSLFLLLAACGDGEEAKLEAAEWEKVMANHDVIMPLMSTTNKVRRDLKDIIDTKENLPPATVENIQRLIKNLDQADEDMMDWMNGFQQLEKLQAEKEHDELMRYLAIEDAKIKKVGVDMNSAIQRGIDFLEAFGQQ